VPEAFLECHQFRRTFSISRNLLILVVIWSYFLGGLVVYGFEQSLNSSIHPPFMVFITKKMVCELIFQAVSNCVGFLGWMKFKA
jgi:hypothetical protein